MTNKDIVEGKLKQVEGEAQEGLGRLVGDDDARIKGAGKVAEGKIQEGYGDVKHAVADALDSDEEDER